MHSVISKSSKASAVTSTLMPSTTVGLSGFAMRYSPVSVDSNQSV